MFATDRRKLILALLAITTLSCFGPSTYVKQKNAYIQRVTCDGRYGWYTNKSYQPEDFEKAKSLIQKYGEGNGFTVMTLIERAKRYCNKEGDHVMTWLLEKQELFYPGLSTAVHEETHSFTSSAHYDLLGKHVQGSGNTIEFEIPYGNYSSFYLEGWGVHHIKTKALYDSIEITNIMPAKKFSGLRYDTYITGSQYNASRQFGIYGLLDEYHAYYHGVKLSYQMQKAGLYQDHSNEYTSFVEFTLFILKYLEYAEKKHPKIYKATMNDAAALDTFIQIYDKFEPIYCELAKQNDKFNLNISNYKNLGKVTYKGSSCDAALTLYGTTGTGKVFYSFSKEMEPYINELKSNPMKKLLKKVRAGARGKSAT